MCVCVCVCVCRTHSEPVATVTGVPIHEVSTATSIQTGPGKTLVIFVLAVGSEIPSNAGTVVGGEQILWKKSHNVKIIEL